MIAINCIYAVLKIESGFSNFYVTYQLISSKCIMIRIKTQEELQMLLKTKVYGRWPPKTFLKGSLKNFKLTWYLFVKIYFQNGAPHRKCSCYKSLQWNAHLLQPFRVLIQAYIDRVLICFEGWTVVKVRFFGYSEHGGKHWHFLPTWENIFSPT